MPALLVEIGVEDLPAEEAEAIAESFRENLLAGLKEARLPHGKAHLFWTLRRFALLVEDVAEKQEDTVEEIRGPAVSVGLDSQGNLTPAALGFLRRYGASPDKLVRRPVGEKEYLFFAGGAGGPAGFGHFAGNHSPGRAGHPLLEIHALERGDGFSPPY